MKMQTTVRGFTVKGLDSFGSYFTSGLSYTLSGAKKDYAFMMRSKQFDEETKKSLAIIKVLEVEELVDI